MKKKKLKLKPKPFIILGTVILVIVFGIWIGVKQYRVWVYHNSLEYKLLERGYTSDEIKLFNAKLDQDTIENLLKSTKNANLSKIVGQKYFIKKNLDNYLAYFEKNSKKDLEDIIAIINVGSNKDWYTDINFADISKKPVLVNKFYNLKNDYIPADLTQISNRYAYGDEHQASKDAVDAYVSMWNAAKSAGYTLIVNSGYRSFEDQEKVYKYYDDNKGKKYADIIAARPGHSEHQLGESLDIFDYQQGSNKDFETTDTYKWLIEHAHEYGFILRYPEGKEYLTGFTYESWHFRYVGIEIATKIYNEKITFDEYCAFYIAK